MLASVAMMFEYSLGRKAIARSIEQAISACITEGECTADLGGTLNTSEAGQAVRDRLGENDLSQASTG